MDPVGARFVTAKTTYIADGKTLNQTYNNEYSAIQSSHGAPWFLAHRVDLHAELKRMATTEDGIGKPVILKPNSRVIHYVRISNLHNLSLSADLYWLLEPRFRLN